MKPVFLIIACFSMLTFQAQNFDTFNDSQWAIDSLSHILSRTKSDSLKCVLYFKLSDLYVKNSNFKEYEVCKRKANSLKKNVPFLNDLSHFYNASDYYFKNDYKGYLNALILANEKLKKYHFPEMYSLRARILRNQSIGYQNEGNEKEPFRILIDEAIPLAKKGSDPEILAIIYYTLGAISFNNENYVKAEYYFLNTITELEKKVVFQMHLLVDSYLQYSHVLIKLGKQSSALVPLEKARKILKSNPYSNLNSTYYMERGYYDHHMKNYQTAIDHYDKGIAIGIKANDPSTVLRVKLLKTNTLNTMKRFGEAKKLLIETINDKNILVSDKREATKDLASAYKNLNDFRNAVNYYERYISLSDSLDENSNKKIIADLEAKFNNSENKHKIKELEIQKQRALLTAKNNRLHNIVFGLVSFLLLLLTIFVIKNSKNQKRIADQKEINYSQSMSSLKTQKELEIMQAMINSEETERKRIARDLHDGIGSRLSALKMQLKGLNNAEANSVTFNDFSNLLSMSILELRQIAFNLMPETLLKLGIELAIKDLCHSLSTENVAITFHANEISESIKANDQIAIFRIVQELINNALKHANCSEIIVDCSQNQNLFLITVEDNGQGFKIDDLDKYTGLGLKNIKNRIGLLNGKLEVHSKSNIGSVFNIELCIQGNKAHHQ